MSPGDYLAISSTAFRTMRCPVAASQASFPTNLGITRDGCNRNGETSSRPSNARKAEQDANQRGRRPTRRLQRPIGQPRNCTLGRTSPNRVIENTAIPLPALSGSFTTLLRRRRSRPVLEHEQSTTQTSSILSTPSDDRPPPLAARGRRQRRCRHGSCMTPASMSACYRLWHTTAMNRRQWQHGMETASRSNIPPIYPETPPFAATLCSNSSATAALSLISIRTPVGRAGHQVLNLDGTCVPGDRRGLAVGMPPLAGTDTQHSSVMQRYAYLTSRSGAGSETDSDVWSGRNLTTWRICAMISFRTASRSAPIFTKIGTSS